MERLKVQLEAKTASEELLRRQLNEMGSFLRTLPPRVGTALSGSGDGKALPLIASHGDGATRSAVVGAIAQQVDAQLGSLERHRAERDAAHAKACASAVKTCQSELASAEAEMRAQREIG